MLFDNIWNDKEDRFYFMYAFACRSWFLFLFVLFSPTILRFLSFTLNWNQVYLLIVASSFLSLVDLLGALIKTISENQKIRRTEIAHHGQRKFS